MNRRRGVALAAALGLMVLLGVLIAGALAASTAAQRAAWLSQSDAVLSPSADYALGTLLADWQNYLLADLPLGAARAIDVRAAAGAPMDVRVSVTRLPDDVLWLVADARSGGPDRGSRRFAVTARFATPGPPPPAGIVARGSVILAAALRTIVDTTGDADCAATAAAPDVIVAPGATWSVEDSARIVADARALDTATYYLAPRQLAWLDSATTVRHVAGDTTIAGGSYQGILLVDGTLRISKPFAVAGLVVARGPIESSDSLRVTGALVSFAASPQTSISLSAGTVAYAPCVVARELRRAARPHPIRERSWSEIF